MLLQPHQRRAGQLRNAREEFRAHGGVKALRVGRAQHQQAKRGRGAVDGAHAQRQQGSRYAVDAQLVDEFRDDAKIPYKLVDQPKIVDELNDPRGGWNGIYVKNQPRDSLKHQPEVRERVRAGGIGLDNSKGLDEQRKSVLKATKRNQKERVVGAGGFNNMAGGIYEVASPRRSHTFIEKQPESDLLRAYLDTVYAPDGVSPFRIGEAQPFVVPAAYLTGWNKNLQASRKNPKNVSS